MMLHATTTGLSRGTLYVVALPIGHSDDLTPRARTTLLQVDAIVAEDTRRAKLLAQSLQLKAPILSTHLRDEHRAATTLLERLAQGQSLALISDAGTPAISDPGGWVVQQALEQGYRVIPIPGACAAVVAWSAAGFTETAFLFYGFLPSKKQARRQTLETLKTLAYPIIFYEAPHRIQEMLADSLAILGNRTATVARELTKTYETIQRGSLESLNTWAQNDTNVSRGELIVIVEGLAPESTPDILPAHIVDCLSEMLADNSLVSSVAWIQRLTGLPKDIIYQTALKLKA
jgi:16S rRNA (cytidine1402-2'-O)-methyltransferase